MALDIFRTHTLLRAVEQLLPLTTFLRDRYFPTNDATDVFATDDVLVEYKDGSKRLAPFVAPRKGGLTILREGYTMERYAPPFIAPRRMLTIDELNKRGFGEALYSNLTPEQRQAALILKDADEMSEMIARREEAMAAELLRTNGYIMKHYADDLSKFDEKEIRFYSGGSNPAIYTPTYDWDNASANIIADIAAMALLLTSRGLPATDLLVAPDVADTMLADPKIQKLLDIKNYNLGMVEPELLPAGAAKVCVLNIKGRLISVYSYDETYENDAGVATQYIPAGYAILTAPAAGRTLYGAVSQVEQSDGLFHTYTGRRVPKYISNAEGNTRSLTVTSCPLLIPNNKNAWITAQVIS
ncbi:MAG: major capsid protein [Candidatus Dehalobacter alkaniphilus]